MNNTYVKCRICNKEKLLCRENFQVRRNYASGFDVACKPCRRKKHREHTMKKSGIKKYREDKPETDLCMQYDNSIYC